MWSAGGELLSDDGRSLSLDQPAALEGLQWVADWRFQYEIAPPVGAKAKFANGNVGLAKESAFYLAPPEINWGFVGFPKGEASDAGYSRGGANIVAIGATSEHQEAAWSFVKYLDSEEAQRLEVLQNKVGNPFLRSIAFSTQYWQRSAPPWDYRPVLNAAWKEAPTFPEWPEVDALVQASVKQIWKEGRTAKAAVEAMLPAANQILANREQ